MVFTCWHNLKLINFVVVNDQLFVIKTLLFITWCKMIFFNKLFKISITPRCLGIFLNKIQRIKKIILNYSSTITEPRL